VTIIPRAVAELVSCQALRGEVSAPAFPPQLAATAPSIWRFCRSFSLDYARAHAKRGNVAGVAGQAAAAVMEEAHAVVCQRSQWVCNEKRLIELAGLQSANELFADIPAPGEQLVEWVELVADRLGESRGEPRPWRGD